MFKLSSTLGRTKLGEVRQTCVQWEKSLLSLTGRGNESHRSGVGKNAAFFSTTSTSLAKLEVDGVKLNWQKFGKGDHVVLLLPGLVGSISGNFAPVVKLMDLDKFQLIGWDPPGYGRSRPPNRNVYTKGFVLEEDAQLAAKLMQKLGHEKYSMIGWSNGGVSGAVIAGLFPERVNRLVMCNSPSGYSDHTKKIMQVMVDLEYWSPTQRKALLRDYEKSYVEQMLKDWKNINDQHGGKKVKDGFSKSMVKIKCPTLYIRGLKDLVVPKSDVDDYAGWIPNFKIHPVANGGHDHLEFVDEFVKATQEFLLAS